MSVTVSAIRKLSIFPKILAATTIRALSSISAKNELVIVLDFVPDITSQMRP